MDKHPTHIMFPFYSLEDGTRDPVTELLDCRCCPLYFVARLEHGDIPNPYALFLEDPALRVVTRDDGALQSIDLANRRLFATNAFDVDFTVGQPFDVTVASLERRLDAGEMLIVHTHSSVIPYVTSYDPSQSLLPYFGPGSGHVFLIVGHNADHYFYVDMPNPDRAVHYGEHPLNPNVSVAPKKSMEKAFRLHLDIYKASTNGAFFQTYDPDRECLDFLERMLAVPAPRKGLQTIIGFLEETDMCEVNVDPKSVVDTAYCMFFLALEVAYKYKILNAALAASPSDVFARSFTPSMGAISDVVEAIWPVVDIVSPFNKTQVDLADRHRLASCLRNVALAEDILYDRTRNDFEAWSRKTMPND